MRLTDDDRIEIQEWLEDYNNNHIKTPHGNKAYKLLKNILLKDEKVNNT